MDSLSVLYDISVPGAGCSEKRTRTGMFRVDNIAKGPVGIQGVEADVFYDKPFLTFELLLDTHYAFAPRGLRSFLLSIPDEGYSGADLGKMW
jgi:hypothetical protein